MSGSIKFREMKTSRVLALQPENVFIARFLKFITFEAIHLLIKYE